MTKFNLIMNSAHRDLIEFFFLIAFGYAAGILGII